MNGFQVCVLRCFASETKSRTRKSVTTKRNPRSHGNAIRDRGEEQERRTRTQGAITRKGSNIPPTTPWVVLKGQYSWYTTFPNLVKKQKKQKKQRSSNCEPPNLSLESLVFLFFFVFFRFFLFFRFSVMDLNFV